LGSLINLAGIISAVEQYDNLDAAVLHNDFAFPTVRDRSSVDRFSQLMSTLYGNHTALRVTYFARDYQTVATIDIPIKKSADFFYNGEIFDRKTGRHTFQPLPAYDAFFGRLF
jgi:hypothetical protein